MMNNKSNINIILEIKKQLKKQVLKNNKLKL